MQAGCHEECLCFCISSGNLCCNKSFGFAKLWGNIFLPVTHDNHRLHCRSFFGRSVTPAIVSGERAYCLVFVIRWATQVIFAVFEQRSKTWRNQIRSNLAAHLNTVRDLNQPSERGWKVVKRIPENDVFVFAFRGGWNWIKAEVILHGGWMTAGGFLLPQKFSAGWQSHGVSVQKTELTHGCDHSPPNTRPH